MKPAQHLAKYSGELSVGGLSPRYSLWGYMPNV